MTDPAVGSFGARFRRGDPLLGALVRMPNEGLVELAGLVGLDYVVIDTEHGPGDQLALAQHLTAAAANGLATIVRIGRPEEALRVLDLGVDGDPGPARVERGPGPRAGRGRALPTAGPARVRPLQPGRPLRADRAGRAPRPSARDRRHRHDRGSTRPGRGRGDRGAGRHRRAHARTRPTTPANWAWSAGWTIPASWPRPRRYATTAQAAGVAAVSIVGSIQVAAASLRGRRHGRDVQRPAPARAVVHRPGRGPARGRGPPVHLGRHGSGRDAGHTREARPGAGHAR